MGSPAPVSFSVMTRAELEQWALFGASWQVVRLTDDRVVLDMLSCTGELVERRESSDRELIGWLRALAEAPPTASSQPAVAGR